MSWKVDEMPTSREAVFRALGKKVAFEMNFDLLDQTDAMDTITRERDDVELLEQTLKEGRENNIGAIGGLKLRQGLEPTSRIIPLPVTNSGLRRENSDYAAGTRIKPRLVHVVFLISLLTLFTTSLFTLFDSITIFEVAYKVHALAGIVRRNFPDPARHGQRERWRGTRFAFEDTQEKTTGSTSQENLEAASESSSTTSWAHFPVRANNDVELLSRQIQDTRCRENSTHTFGAHIFGLPTPEKDDVIRLTAGSVHSIRLDSYDLFGQKRCAGGDYFETELRSPYWKSRPPVLDFGNGTYELTFRVDPRFAGRFIFKIVLLFSNFDGLKQLDQGLSGHEFKKHYHDRPVASLHIEFVLPPGQAQITGPQSANAQFQEVEPASAIATSTAPRLKLQTCKRKDFNLRQWSGRWTRGAFNPTCSIDLEDNDRWKCLDPETKCERPWCEGALGGLESNGWVYSAHCSFKIFSRDEAWKCLDGKWLFWWSDSNDQENTLVRDLLKSVLGLTLPEGRWDGMGRFSNKVFVRPNSTVSAHGHGQHRKAAIVRDSKQQVRMTNMWNANVESRPEHFQGVFSSYFTKFSSPDMMIMNSGLQDGTHWRNWTEFVDVGVQSAPNFWKETFDSILPTKHPRVVYSTTGANDLSAFNPQLMDIYTRFLLDAYVKANLTSDFRIVDGFDPTFSWMGRYERNQHFVNLMLVHMLLNAVCTVD